MDLNALLLATLVVLPALGLAAWTWFAVTRIGHDLLAPEGLRSRDFEI